MKRPIKDINEWVSAIEKERDKIADSISRKRTGKGIDGCRRQEKLKIMASVDRIIYE